MSTTLSITQLPSVVRRYLELQESADAIQAADLFAEDASVSDEGRTYHGREEIRAWIAASKAAYEYSMEFLGARETDELVGISFRLTGNFPGGTVDLEYQFQIDSNGQITHLYFA